MANIIVGEKIINKKKELGTIIAVDDQYIHVDYNTRVTRLQLSALEQGFIKYVDPNLQENIDEIIEQKKAEEEKKSERLRVKAEDARAARNLAAIYNAESNYNANFLSVTVRLDPAPVRVSSVAQKDQNKILEVFAECDKDIKELYQSFKPYMTYPKNTSRSRSKSCIGFLTKYLDTYVLRCFSRNDIYKKTVTTGVTVMNSDTTEVMRILWVNGKIYYFSKNLSYSDGYFNNSNSYNTWHISEVAKEVMLNDVIRKCDCQYLNDYISEKNIACMQYTRLLFPALYNNKAEIVFKHRLFTSTYRIENLIDYLAKFTSKQIDFACKNDVVNTLPIIKSHGMQDLNLLLDLETFMRPRAYGGSTYDMLKKLCEGLNFDCSDLDKRIVGFAKKVEFFNVGVYHDYITRLARRPGVNLNDFFDKDYLDRHYIMEEESMVRYTPEESIAYQRVANELSWIDRIENEYHIIVPKTIPEFKYEGQMQHNCVYTMQYYNYVVNRESIVIFLRKEIDIPYVTIEFDYETFDVLQAYGKYNKRIDKDLYQYIVQLGKRLNYERLTQM